MGDDGLQACDEGAHVGQEFRDELRRERDDAIDERIHFHGDGLGVEGGEQAVEIAGQVRHG